MTRWSDEEVDSSIKFAIQEERFRIRREQAVHIAALRNSEDEFVRYVADRLEEATRDA